MNSDTQRIIDALQYMGAPNNVQAQLEPRNGVYEAHNEGIDQMPGFDPATPTGSGTPMGGGLPFSPTRAGSDVPDGFPAAQATALGPEEQAILEAIMRKQQERAAQRGMIE